MPLNNLIHIPNMKTRYLLTCPEYGVFLGTMWGLAFWSELDPVGQDAAITFESKEEAHEFADSWTGTQPEGMTTLEVIPDLADEYASVEACARAGAKPWLTATTEVCGGVQ